MRPAYRVMTAPFEKKKILIIVNQSPTDTGWIKEKME